MLLPHTNFRPKRWYYGIRSLTEEAGGVYAVRQRKIEMANEVEIECPTCVKHGRVTKFLVAFEPGMVRCPDQGCGQEIEIIAPQEGPQLDFLAKCDDTDIVVFGGAAGGSKTFSLLLDPLRFVDNPLFRATILRRTSKMITHQGALWEDSFKIYPWVGGSPRETPHEWIFPSGARIRFSQMEHEQDRFNFDGSQIAYIGIDQAEQFTYGMVFYMLSRTRSMSGIRPRMRLTINPPDPNKREGQWFHGFLKPWVDPLKPHEEHVPQGEKMWFIQEGPKPKWVEPGTPHAMSVTYIGASVYDNRVLLKQDPHYLTFLHNLPYEDRQRLLHGSWAITSLGKMFHRDWFEVVNVLPKRMKQVRIWDKAGTDSTEIGADSAAYTVGLKVGMLDGIYYVLHEVRGQWGDKALSEIMRNTAIADGPYVAVREEMEPGASGKLLSSYNARVTFAGFDYKELKPMQEGDKITRAKPAAVAAERRAIKVFNAQWTEDFLDEVCQFPDGLKDRADCLAWAVIELGGSHKPADLNQPVPTSWGTRPLAIGNQAYNENTRPDYNFKKFFGR